MAKSYPGSWSTTSRWKISIIIYFVLLVDFLVYPCEILTSSMPKCVEGNSFSDHNSKSNIFFTLRQNRAFQQTKIVYKRIYTGRFCLAALFGIFRP